MQREILKQIFKLSEEEILNIYKILNGYKEHINKSKTDTLLARCVFVNGFSSIKTFLEDLKTTKDSMLYKALGYETTNIKAYITLKSFLNIDDETFDKILTELIMKENREIIYEA